jgi:hypothetical protein
MDVVMPYIRYRGGRLPSSISEHVSCEDPNAPCKKGLAELMADGRRFTEVTYNYRIERAKALESYLNSHQYPGLEHIGGVGLVQAALRSIDEEITAEEYQQIRSEIEKANKEYHERKVSELTTNNGL